MALMAAAPIAVTSGVPAKAQITCGAKVTNSFQSSSGAILLNQIVLPNLPVRQNACPRESGSSLQKGRRLGHQGEFKIS
jgi:hypothetical protein